MLKSVITSFLSFNQSNLIKKTFVGIFAGFIIAVPAYAKDLTVSYIDIGQGDSELIELPDGKNILIDAGDKDASNKLGNYLKERKVAKLDLVIITHPHLDHYGGLLQASKNVEISEVFDSGAPTLSSTYLKLLKQFAAKKVKFSIARRGQELKYGNGIVIKILAPEDPLLKNTRSDTNNSSIVSKLTYNKVSFLFTGDIEEESQDKMLKESGSDLKADILKVAHHGSRYTSSKDFLDTVKPKIAVISCGTGNSYKHPHQETLQRLKEENIKLYRTDLDGTVIITSDGNDFKIQTKKTGGQVPVSNAKTDLNNATPEELELLPGMNSTKSKLLINMRPLKAWGQLKKLDLTKDEIDQMKNLSFISSGNIKETKPANNSADKTPVNTSAKVNINTASFKELVDLPQIGDKLAKRIIDGRPYKSVEDLGRIQGITKNRLNKIINLITVN